MKLPGKFFRPAFDKLRANGNFRITPAPPVRAEPAGGRVEYARMTRSPVRAEPVEA